MGTGEQRYGQFVALVGDGRVKVLDLFNAETEHGFFEFDDALNGEVKHLALMELGAYHSRGPRLAAMYTSKTTGDDVLEIRYLDEDGGQADESPDVHRLDIGGVIGPCRFWGAYFQ